MHVWKNLSAAAGGGRRLLFTIGFVLLVGCDSGPKRHHLSGEVKFNGNPVPAGEIYFDPDVTKGHDGPQGFARIKDGRYDTRAAGLPMTAGPHFVRILGFDAVPGPEQPLGKRLFPEYRTSATIPDEGDATLHFDVPERKQGK
jgi:hypothetical protein